MTIKESGQVEDADNWSTIPTLLLWMIKSRLDCPNGVRFSSVCKNWQDAYGSYPVHSFEVNNTPPWIMSCKKISDARRKFVSLLTEESYTVDNHDFIASEVLHSRQGWLLMVKMKPHEPGSMNTDVDTNFKSPYWLLNPFKNISIKLPFLAVKFCHGGFTIQDGNPHCIIVLGNNLLPNIVLYITHSGDNAWLCYRFTSMIKELSGEFWVRWTFIIGKLVYLITKKGFVFVFNITDSQWTELVKESKGPQSKLRFFDDQYMVERKGGELLRVQFPQGVRKISKANCYKLKINGRSAHWELMQMDGHGNICGHTCFWFLTQLFGQNFIFEINKVHELVRLQKAFSKRNNRTKNKGINTLSLCRSTNSWWVNMD